MLFGSLMNKQFVSVTICCVIFIEFTHLVFRFRITIIILNSSWKSYQFQKSFRNDCISCRYGIKNDASGVLLLHVILRCSKWFGFASGISLVPMVVPLFLKITILMDWDWNALLWNSFSSVNEGGSWRCSSRWSVAKISSKPRFWIVLFI